MLKFWRNLSIFLCSIFLISCNSKEPADQIRVGTISGPETQLMEVAKNVALEKYGLHVKIIPFSDYNMPNQALRDGSIDVNMFQHTPYLVMWNTMHEGNLVAVAKGFIYPMGMYSYKVDRISDLKPGDVIAIPNDPTNEARALLLLQQARLIKLKPNVNVTSTTDDIVSNPLGLKIKSLDAGQLTRVLPDVDAAVINTNYAIPAGLDPARGDNTSNRYDAIYLEDKQSLYANVFVTTKNNSKEKKMKELIEAYQSPQVLAAARNIFKGSAIQAW
ncbi:MAG: MetQ/NlpA family ABC transporter substrate-binding protein [Gammaproteobacteria bacterium]|nr:MetQ/NlpA family ABC transporter substrate-binding protein [Gammaproteobacteria bacterium]